MCSSYFVEKIKSLYTKYDGLGIDLNSFNVHYRYSYDNCLKENPMNL